jgi:hypothetical protein
MTDEEIDAHIATVKGQLHVLLAVVADAIPWTTETADERNQQGAEIISFAAVEFAAQTIAVTLGERHGTNEQMLRRMFDEVLDMAFVGQVTH